MKKFLFLIIILAASFFSEGIFAQKARGVFISFGVGPRLPISSFANSTALGYGFNIEIAYTDNEYIPFFFFGRVGYEQYPGSQDFYRATDYSNLSTQSFPVNAGIRYYFPPLVENVALFMPILEVSALYNYYIKLHQFKPVSNKSNFTENSSKIGASIGGGLSMFLMEIMASYTFIESNQFLSVDLKIRLPLFMNF